MSHSTTYGKSSYVLSLQDRLSELVKEDLENSTTNKVTEKTIRRVYDDQPLIKGFVCTELERINKKYKKIDNPDTDNKASLNDNNRRHAESKWIEEAMWKQFNQKRSSILNFRSKTVIEKVVNNDLIDSGVVCIPKKKLLIHPFKVLITLLCDNETRCRAVVDASHRDLLHKLHLSHEAAVSAAAVLLHSQKKIASSKLAAPLLMLQNDCRNEGFRVLQEELIERLILIRCMEDEWD